MDYYNKAKMVRYSDCITYLQTLKKERIARFKESDVPPSVVNEFRESIDSVVDELTLLKKGSHALSAVKVEQENIKLTKKVKEAMIRKNIVSRQCFVSPLSHPDDWAFLNRLHKMTDSLLLSIVKTNRGATWTAKQLEHVDDPKWVKDSKTFLRGRKGLSGKVGLTLLYLFQNHPYLFKGSDDREFMNLASVGAAKWSKAPPNIRRLYRKVKNMNSNLDRKKAIENVIDD